MSTKEDRSHGRRFIRAHVEVPVTLIVPGDELILDAHSLDISLGGMRVSTSTDVPAGRLVVLRFTLPDGERELLVRGRVVLSFFDAARRSYAHGVAFTQYTPHDHEEISRFVTVFEAADTQ
ncbi:MAG: PilZ domain-containing protein [Vulcanimicrobiaceae bacterium]